MSGALVVCAAAAAVLAAPPPPVAAVDEASVLRLLEPEPDFDGLKRLGPGVMPALVSLYARSGVTRRTGLAAVFYRLGFESAEAKRALMQDIRTDDETLRLNVQWALGRVSGDPDVVDVLLDTMRHDRNPLFRDKAACALAHDQIHLTEEQKIRLYERLIAALRDPKLQVREIALQALRIHTGQTKDFSPGGSPAEREAAIGGWERWLDEYRSNL
ncbi:MAG: HEAT repeat domain-containing protein [Candidatus Polarisedimenticolia bacterium]